MENRECPYCHKKGILKKMHKVYNKRNKVFYHL